MNLEEAILKFGFVCDEIKGTSMNPLFVEGRDKVYIEKYNGNLKVGDIALYRRDGGELVLHRLVKIVSGNYVFCGDNHTILEYGIKDSNILGVCTAYYKNGKFKKLKGFRYRLYILFYAKSAFIKKVRAKLLSIKNNKK